MRPVCFTALLLLETRGGGRDGRGGHGASTHRNYSSPRAVRVGTNPRGYTVMTSPAICVGTSPVLIWSVYRALNSRFHPGLRTECDKTFLKWLSLTLNDALTTSAFLNRPYPQDLKKINNLNIKRERERGACARGGVVRGIFRAGSSEMFQAMKVPSQCPFVPIL
jgi:hypothetical protein